MSIEKINREADETRKAIPDGTPCRRCGTTLKAARATIVEITVNESASRLFHYCDICGKYVISLMSMRWQPRLEQEPPISTQEAMTLAKVSRKTINNWWKTGRIKRRIIGGYIMFDKKEVEKALRFKWKRCNRFISLKETT